MIPKIIHYCWLSNDPYPKSIQSCIDSWGRVLPDYELRLWTLADFNRDEHPWIFEAFERKKYAFAADYVRNYALYNYGGIYLDSDVEVLKSFNPLLDLPYFMCYENGSGFIDAGVMASEPGNPVFKKMLEYYAGRHFIKADDSIDTLPLPQIMTRVLAPVYQFVEVSDPEHFDYENGHLAILPFDYFSPIHQIHGELQSTDRTLAIHRYASSWAPWHHKLKNRMKKLLGPRISSLFIKLKRKFKRT